MDANGQNKTSLTVLGGETAPERRPDWGRVPIEYTPPNMTWGNAECGGEDEVTVQDAYAILLALMELNTPQGQPCFPGGAFEVDEYPARTFFIGDVAAR
jgi:hypothetical protein